MSTSITNTTPLGTLVQLPPELRDQIYDHVFDRSYLVFWTYYHNNGYTSPDGNGPTIFADLEIRCVSKALSAEASARLFSNATFFAFLIRFDHDDRLSPPPTKKVTEKMMNMEFVVDTGAPLERDYISMVEDDMVCYERSIWGDHSSIVPMVTANGEVRRRQTIYYPATMDPRCEASVDHFTGDEIERNNFLISFRDFDANFHLFMATRFFQALKKCVGFRTTTLLLEGWQLHEWDDSTIALMEKVEEVRMELGQCWGPCVVKNVLDQYENKTGEADMRLYFAFELTFQPLKFRGENLKAGVARVLKEAGQIEEVS